MFVFRKMIQTKNIFLRNTRIFSCRFFTESCYKNYQNEWQDQYQKSSSKSYYKLLTKGIIFTFGCGYLISRNDFRPSLVNCKELKPENHSIDDTRVYTEEEVLKHKTIDNGIWVTYNGFVYNITDFVSKHPGGNKILLAAGGALEPFWDLYAVHKTAEVLHILEKYKIGRLKDTGKAKIKSNDPFATDPNRHPALRIVSDKPFNAESPPEILMDNIVTPNEIFFVRNHLPVPQVDIDSFTLNLSGLSVRGNKSLTVSALKSKFPKRTVRSSVMCAGNRRSDMSNYKQVKGLSWKGTAISTADWTGVSLRDLLKWVGVDTDDLKKHNIKHVQFEGLDKDPEGMHYGASIPVEIVSEMLDDIIIAYEMNGKELPRDHGYPLRVIIPGIVGARQVKWLHKIVLSEEESPSFWQQRDYKTFSPSTDWSTLDYSKSPAIMEPPVISAICIPQPGEKLDNDGSISVKGYAWSGGGRGILRVEVSVDGGETWHLAELHSANETSYFRKQWAWTLWEADIPLPENYRGNVEIICKAVDTSQNTQPESYKGIWNVRGLLANAWHRVNVDVVGEDD